MLTAAQKRLKKKTTKTIEVMFLCLSISSSDIPLLILLLPYNLITELPNKRDKTQGSTPKIPIVTIGIIPRYI